MVCWGAVILPLVLHSFAHGDDSALAAPPAKAAAEPVAAAPAAPGTVGSLVQAELPDAVSKIKLSANVRLRYEYADTATTDASHAPTLRTRLGLTTPDFHGFQGMVEGENILVLGDLDNALYPGQTANGKTLVPDPPTTELNQAWARYANTNWNVALKGGRQRLVLDNARFVGDVGWRQNQQTYDAVTLSATPVEGLNLFYGWIGRVNRIFGNVSDLAPGQTDFQSSSHVLNGSYEVCEHAKVTVYTYLLDLENAAANDPASSATYGFDVTGQVPAGEKVALSYRGAFAWQTDYAGNTQDYGAPYYNLEGSAAIKPFTVGAGYEVLGSDGGAAAFQTPLATGHAFNGWADRFLTTPATGLQDIYAFVGVKIPKAEMPLKVVYHKFDADSGGTDYGQEIDVVLSKKFAKHWTAIAKYAHFDGAGGAYVDIDKFWLELNFVF